uniref:Uncharacterized protein n=1 Tax=Oryza punctata TaxID=4537 RepID=A0A0E0LZ80_ORYPU
MACRSAVGTGHAAVGFPAARVAHRRHAALVVKAQADMDMEQMKEKDGSVVSDDPVLEHEPVRHAGVDGWMLERINRRLLWSAVAVEASLGCVLLCAG